VAVFLRSEAAFLTLPGTRGGVAVPIRLKAEISVQELLDKLDLDEYVDLEIVDEYDGVEKRWSMATWVRDWRREHGQFQSTLDHDQEEYAEFERWKAKKAKKRA
jgi:hypothetical protein